MSVAERTTMSGQEMVALSKQHSLFEWSAQASIDPIPVARAKGIAPPRLIGRHLLRNILIPIVTITALELGTLIAFSTVTETVFSWPGIGKLLLDAIYRSDRPVVVAYMILITLMFVLINLVADIIYAILDPRIRYS